MARAIARLRVRSATAARGDAGFTLPELLIAIIIQGLIMGALAMAFVGILRGSTQTKQSLSKTGDARIAAQYIVSDARNSSGPEISLTDTSSCPDPSPPVAGAASPVARFNWDSTDADGGTNANIVNYVLVSNSLLRRQCVGGALVSDRAVAESVLSVDVSCVPDDDCSGTETSITVTVTETPDTNGTSYSYTLTSTFRKLLGDGPPQNPKSLILLGGGACTSGAATGIKVAGGAALRVFGDTRVNATDLSTCKSISLGTNAGNYRAGATRILTGGSCVASGSSTCPAYTSYSPALANPYASLPVPSTAGMPSQSGCPGGTAQPGVYAATLSIPAGCNFASGVYVFQNGMSITNSGAVTNSAGGVFFYFAGGTFTESGNSTVNLTAMTSGSYANVLMWVAGTSPLVISNGGQLALNGVLYAPSTQVQFTGGSVTTTVTSIVAQSISLSGGASVSLGSPSASPLSISSTALANWTQNQPNYSFTPVVNGGDGIYTYAAPNLPAGLSINSSTGEISGKPTATGTTNVSVTVTDQLGDDPVTKSLPITVSVAPSITTTTLTKGEIGASYSVTVNPSGGTSPYTWSATGLPAGLSINSSTGVIYGTPTGSAGTATVNVSLTDAAGATATKNNLSLQVVSAVTISTASLPAGEKTLAYSQTVAASGGQTSYSWSAIGLPTGLSIASGTGVISGTPSGTPGTATVSVTVTDALGGTDTDTFSLTINPQPSISSVVLANGGSTPGQIEQGDTVTIVFSQTMKASTLCSAWTTNNTNYSITADNAVTVSVSNASPDALTVTSTGCTFGSLALGSSSYTSVAATFKGTVATGGNSTITWTAATNTLVIKLGAKTAGTLAPVASSQPVYSGWTSVKDAQGVGLSSTSFTLPTQQHF